MEKHNYFEELETIGSKTLAVKTVKIVKTKNNGFVRDFEQSQPLGSCTKDRKYGYRT
jgi:hypothetical protein